VIRGPAGIGKTALLEAAAADAAEHGMTVLRTRGLEAETELPFAGLGELFGPILALRERLPAAQAAALDSALALEGAGPGAPARLAIGAAVLGLLALAAEDAPVLCLLDDLQWVDEASREAWRFAARRLGEEGVAALGALRPSPGDATAGIEVADLDALGDADARALLAATRTVSDPVAARVVETAGGNPLALMEIPALLSPDELAGRAALEGPLPPGSSLERVMARRLDALPDDTRDALVVAAAAEARRGDVVLRALHEAGIPSHALEHAEEAGLVELGPGEVVFRHPLVRSAAYHAAAPIPRRRAHLAVAAALAHDDPQRAWHLAAASLRPDETVAAELDVAAAGARGRGAYVSAAHAHLRAAELSEDPVRRAVRLVEAARDLQPAGRAEEGLARLEQAESVLAASDSPEVAGVATALRTLRAQLALRVGRPREAVTVLREQAARIEAEEPLQAVVLLLQAALAAASLQDARLWGEIAERALSLSAGTGLLTALAALAGGPARLAVPDTAGGRALLAEGEALLDASGIAAAVALAPELVGLAAHGWLWLEEYERGLAMLDRLVAAGRDAAAVGALPYPLAARAQANLRLGHLAQARADADEAVALAEQTGQDPALVIALGSLAMVAAVAGEAGACRAAAGRGLALGAQRGLPLPSVYAIYALDLLATGLEAPDALERAEAIRDAALAGNVVWIPDLVDALLRAGRRDEAREWVERYAALAAGKRAAPAVAERMRGLLAPDAAAAEAHLRAAVALHAGAPGPVDAGRTQLALGRALHDAGRDEEAREPLREALEAFERAGARPWADRARRELRATGAVARNPVAAPSTAALSPHEQRVAQLVAQGMTNREVAAALFVSTKTVEHHLRGAFRKLGVRRRAELARVMAST
jgi:DNA-binding CsgD family transcriptional regulator